MSTIIYPRYEMWMQRAKEGKGRKETIKVKVVRFFGRLSMMGES
jgi:hypothetical protein